MRAFFLIIISREGGEKKETAEVTAMPKPQSKDSRPRPDQIVKRNLAAASRLILNDDSPDPDPQREQQIQSLLNAVLDLDPHNSEAHRGLAWSFRITGNNAKAVEHFLKAVEFSTEPSVCLSQAAYVMYADGDLIGARDVCLRGLKTIPEDHFPLHLLLTDIYLDLGEYANALIHATSLSEDGDSDAGTLLRARALAGLERSEDAVAMLREVLSRAELSRHAWLFLGSLLSHLGQAKEAYVVVRDGASKEDHFSDDPFERAMFLQAAALCEAHNDPLNAARYLLRASQMRTVRSNDEATDKSLLNALLSIEPNVNVMKEFQWEFTGGELGALMRSLVRHARSAVGGS